ncbi:MAG: DUF3307 domain-containing protein [Roseobacter sp.]
MILLQAKHMFGDYFLQTKIMLDGREAYFHFGRVLHAAVHAAGSFVAFMIVGAPLAFTFLIVIAELVVHFHIDWWKGYHTSSRNLTPAKGAYWRATGIDQALHQLTYICMIWLWLAHVGFVL